MYNLKLLSHAIYLFRHIFLTFSVESWEQVCHWYFLSFSLFAIFLAAISALLIVNYCAWKGSESVLTNVLIAFSFSPESLPVKKTVLFPRPRSNSPNKLKSLLFSTVLHILPLLWSTPFVWVSFNYWIIHLKGIGFLLPAKHLSSTRGIKRKIVQTLSQRGLSLLEKNSM